jgi:hypothetical protein
MNEVTWGLYHKTFYGSNFVFQKAYPAKLLIITKILAYQITLFITTGNIFMIQALEVSFA